MLFLFRIGSRLFFPVISLVAAVFFLACTDVSENELVLLTALEESLTNSNKTIDKSTESFYTLLKEKLTDPTADRAQVWQTKAIEVRKLTAEMYNYFENMKSELKKEAGIISDDQHTKFNENDSYDVKQQFITTEKGTELFGRMTQYKKDILSIDSDSKEAFKDFLLIAKRIDSLDIAKQNMNRVFFENTSVIASLVALSQFQNNIKNIENRMVQFCVNKTSGGCILTFEVYSAIVAQSSSYLRGGQEIEITAGVGAFSKAAKPMIVFDGKTLPVDESGVAIYKFRTPGKAGEYNVPVKIIYIDQEGRKQTIVKDVEYTVAGENQ